MFVMGREEELWELTEKICDLLDDEGYMTGPCTYGPDKKKSTRTGSDYYECEWSISSYADGSVYVFGPRSIYVNWLYGGNRRANRKFASFNAFEEWVKNREWSDG